MEDRACTLQLSDLNFSTLKGRRQSATSVSRGKTTPELAVHSSCHCPSSGRLPPASTGAFADGWWEGTRVFHARRTSRGQRSFAAAPGRFSEALGKGFLLSCQADLRGSREPKNRPYRTQAFRACRLSSRPFFASETQVLQLFLSLGLGTCSHGLISSYS